MKIETYEWLNRGWRQCNMNVNGKYTYTDAIDDYGSDNVKKIAPGVWLCYGDKRDKSKPTLMLVRTEAGRNHRRD